jgi:hypothetical protein
MKGHAEMNLYAPSLLACDDARTAQAAEVSTKEQRTESGCLVGDGLKMNNHYYSTE